MNFLVIGAGAVGGYLGVRLATSGQEVVFLVRQRRLEALHERGLRIESSKGSATLHPVAATSDPAKLRADVVVVTSKAWDLDSAIEAARPCVESGALVLSVLNGIRQYEVLSRAFGPERIIGGAAYASVDTPEFGVVRHLGTSDRLIIGPWHRDSIAAANACGPLAEALRAAGVEAEVATDMPLDAWEKFTRVGALAAVTTLFSGCIGEIVATDHGRDLALGILDECVAIASAEGYPPRQPHLEQSRARLSAEGSRLTASMMRDMRAGSRTEADAMIGDLVRRARKHRIDVPLLTVAWTRLQVHEARLAAGV